jgi:hypothetical protein
MKYFKDNYLQEMIGCSILDVGSCMVGAGGKSYKDIFGSGFDYIGFDIVSGRNVDIVGYENIDRVFDVVISGQTMEYVKRPWEWLKNLVPYFKKYICIIAPNSCHEHRHPLDTYRYFPDGMRDLFEYADIKELEIFRRGDDTIGIGSHF